ncbi:NADH-quinone oxidoreductase subunit J [Desulfovibrio desulfuricans]|uniref:NADH-quinone oxidoreductase subunit J family protein n=1 Tax=Desulfovibrio desulfuricans TaxID=876 RepID=UPI0035AEFF86
MFGEIFFLYCAFVITVCGVLAISLRNPIHCVLLVLLLFFHMAAVYLTLQAEFLAAVQIIVYAGAILVMYLFVLFLVNLQRELRLPALTPKPVMGYALAAALCGGMLWGVAGFVPGGRGQWPLETLREVTHTRALSRELFTHHFLSLEIAGVLLLIALVAALTLARRQPPAVEAAGAAHAEAQAQAGGGGQTNGGNSACGNKDQGGAA